MNNPEELTVRCQRFLSRMPVIVGYSLRSGTSQICVRWQHSLEQLLDALRYFPSSHPLASHLLFCLSDRWLYRRKGLTVRDQYFSRSSLELNCSPSWCSKGVLPTRISKKVTPRDHTSDLRVSWGTPRARSGERYFFSDQYNLLTSLIFDSPQGSRRRDCYERRCRIQVHISPRIQSQRAQEHSCAK